MTREEAIKILDPESSTISATDIVEKWENISEMVREAHRMAISALRAQQTTEKLDRSRGEGCFICKGASYLDGDICISGTHYARLSQLNFCPDCGRPLTEEAWAEMEKRTGE